MTTNSNNNSNSNSNSNSNNNSSNFNLDLNHLQSQQALFEHEQNLYNNTTKPANGMFDKFEEVRIRTAIIENYTINDNETIDPLNIDKVINMKNGQVVIRWINYNGGMIRPESYGYPNNGYTEPWTYFPDKDSKYPEKRTLDCYNHDKASDREMLSLSHAFIWGNGVDNWCGMNYLPPVGSVVIVGFKKGNLPIILGYLQTHYNSCTPYLKPGETMIKGYGDNYIHWRWSNKLDMHVQSHKGVVDVDDPYKKDTYPNNIEMWMRFDPFTRNIIIDVNQTDFDSPKRSTIEIKPESININVKDSLLNKTAITTISTDDIYLSSSDGSAISSLYISPKKIDISSDGDINLTAKGRVNISDSSK